MKLKVSTNSSLNSDQDMVHHFLGKLLGEQFVLHTLIMDFMTLLVIAKRQFLQSLQNLLNFCFSTLTLSLKVSQLTLDPLTVCT